MPAFGTRSKARLEGVHPDLIKVLYRAVDLVDFTVLEGKRTEAQQRENIEKGVSKTMDSRHLDEPFALAVDIAPWFAEEPHVRWPDASRWTEEEKRFLEMRWLQTIGIIMGVGHEMGVPLTSGLDWDRDFNFEEHSFHDWPHIQLPKGYV